MTDNSEPVQAHRTFNDNAYEIWCPNTDELVPSTLAGPPDFCPNCGDINHLGATT